MISNILDFIAGFIGGYAMMGAIVFAIVKIVMLLGGKAPPILLISIIVGVLLIRVMDYMEARTVGEWGDD